LPNSNFFEYQLDTQTFCKGAVGQAVAVHIHPLRFGAVLAAAGVGLDFISCAWKT
jgi:hypothetical protein